jgi:hypothetical protein
MWPHPSGNSVEGAGDAEADDPDPSEGALPYAKRRPQVRRKVSPTTAANNLVGAGAAHHMGSIRRGSHVTEGQPHAALVPNPTTVPVLPVVSFTAPDAASSCRTEFVQLVLQPIVWASER